MIEKDKKIRAYFIIISLKVIVIETFYGEEKEQTDEIYSIIESNH